MSPADVRYVIRVREQTLDECKEKDCEAVFIFMHRF